MNNTQDRSQNLAPNARRPVLDLTAAGNDGALNQNFVAIAEHPTETFDARTGDEIAFIEPLIGDTDPHSTAFGVKHFWYKAV